MTASGLCRTCGKIMTYVEPGLDEQHHPTCGPNATAGPNHLFAEPPGPNLRDLAMLRDVNEVILWGWRNDHRSLQKMVGPSELGDPCDRKLAYRIAGLPAVNEQVDPWPALVGTAIHRWWENTVQDFQAKAGATRWLTEMVVQPDDLVVGHVDLYDLENRGIWDLKTMNSDKLKKFKALGDPSDWPDDFKAYRVQVHLYGKGVRRAGYKVDTVGLIAVARSGWLSNMAVLSEPYDESIADEALSRMYGIADRVLELAVDDHPQQIHQIEATPSRLCSFCDFYAPEPVNGVGCPGK